MIMHRFEILLLYSKRVTMLKIRLQRLNEGTKIACLCLYQACIAVI